MGWRQRSFGIALGFGIFAVVELATNARWAGYHVSDASMSLVIMVAYNCALLIWLGYVLGKSPAREVASFRPQPQRWEQSLSDIPHPAQWIP